MLGATKKKAPSPGRQEHPKNQNGGHDTENDKYSDYFFHNFVNIVSIFICKGCLSHQNCHIGPLWCI